MTFAGLWKGDRGEFAYAESIPKAALEIVGRRLRGEPDEGPKPTPGEASTAPPAK